MNESQEENQSGASQIADQGREALKQGAERVQKVVEQGKSYAASNPVPIIAGALALGFVLGLLVPREKEAATSRIDGHIDELKDLLGSLKSRVSSTAEDGYSEVSSAIGDVLKKAKKRFNFS
ncbi:MAG: hypothetical protein ABIT76_07620 [Chthoniobacterales bacterium]